MGVIRYTHLHEKMSPMRILITGASGRLGSEIQRRYETDGHTVNATDVDTLDITNWDDVKHTLQDFQPEMVIHCAALTNVDYCAENPDEALRVNGFGTQNVALAASRCGAALLYVSTNEVFAGSVCREYLEYDSPAPINAYGYSKWVGEQAVRDLNPKHMIVRTAWLFAHGGNNFVHAILKRAKQGQPLRVVTNEVSSPTYTSDLADAIVALSTRSRYGIYHLTNAEHVSRYGFARKLLDLTGYADVPIEPVASAEWPRPSRPPEYAILRNFAAAQMGITLRPWADALAAFVQAEWPPDDTD